MDVGMVIGVFIMGMMVELVGYCMIYVVGVVLVVFVGVLYVV